MQLGRYTLSDIKLIVGLGNPGEEYAHTYHNAGTLFVDHLAGLLAPQTAFKAKSSFLYLRTKQIILVRPKTFMNVSGRAVAEAARFFKVRPEEVLVAHDESDLPLGAWKLAFDRGAAGHNGVASVVEALTTKKFWRLRIGVRPKDREIVAGLPALRHQSSEVSATEGRSRRPKAGDFVLRTISPRERSVLYSVFGAASEKITEKLTLFKL